MSSLSIDFETRSTVDLKKSGVHVYAEHPDTDVWCLAWAFDDEEPEIWVPRPGEHDTDCAMGLHGAEACDCPAQYGWLPWQIVRHIIAGGEVRAWNAQFERIIWREIMVKRYGAPVIRDEQFVCSAAEAAAMALPRALGQAAAVLGVEQEKDEKGHRLMMQMCRPRSITDDGTVVWWDAAEKKQRLYDYCKQDVRTERAIVKALRRLTPKEREIYLLDQRINDRGIRCDLELVHAAMDVAAEGKKRADRRIVQLTNGAVSGVTKNARLVDWLNDSDLETESVAKPAIAALLEREDLTADIREVLELRAEAGRASVAKLKAMVKAACADGQLRGLLLYHAASTGRWAGRLVQPQNFPRGEVDDVESFIDWVLKRDYDTINLFAHPIVVVLSLLRGMLTARPGHELIAGDFAAIEARVLNWLAGQDDILNLFRAMDAGDKSRHPYKVMAVRMGRGATTADIKKPSDDYQAGKAAELGCGFGMGWEKFISAAWSVYQLRVTEKEAQDAVEIYRETHPRVKAHWYDVENACLDAVREPGSVHTLSGGKIRVTQRGGYLYIVLPSGRPLMYAAPSIKDREVPWSTKENPVFKPSLHFWAPDQKTKQWREHSAYGGLLVENIVQAVARDLIAEALLRVEAAGYLPVLSVHDEAVCEVPAGFGDLKEFERLMSELPAWAEGCPVAAEAWKGFRYRK